MLALDETLSISVKKILLATDFSALADRAADYARLLAQQFGATVEIAHVFEPDLFPSYSVHGAGTPNERQRRRQQDLMKMQEMFAMAGVKSRTRLSTEFPVGGALLLMAEEESPDLIITATGSKTAFERLTIGSPAEHLIRHAKCPVLTVGPHARLPVEGELVFRNILIAIDFSPASLKAATYGALLARHPGARFRYVHIISRDEPPRSSASSLQEKLTATLKRAGSFSGSDIVIDGDNVAHKIVELANSLDADLIVLGARKGSFWLTHVGRGVTVDVLARANCPVLTSCS